MQKKSRFLPNNTTELHIVLMLKSGSIFALKS